MSSKIVSLTLSRGGSKEIPRKNLVDINGHPLIFYVIDAAKKVPAICENWVSSDCEVILDTARELGAKTIKRPDELATDEASSELGILHFAENVDFDILVFIQTTSPLITSNFIEAGLNKVMSGEHDSVFSVTKEYWLPRWSKNVEPIDWNPALRPRRQEIEERYVENGAFYITTRKQLLKSGLRYSGNIGFIEIPLSQSFGIDTHEDLELIRKLLK